MGGYLLAGVLGVGNIILWGVYGDLLLERFSVIKVIRSLVVAVIFSIYIYILNSNSDLPLIIVAFSVIALERLFTEIYKALIREESQRKYKIPSDLNIDYPRPLEVVFGILLLLLILYIFSFIRVDISKVVIIITAGFIAAIGGMLKDAPYEGFYFFKFFRSPFVAILIGVLIYFYNPLLETKYFLLSIFGGERVLSEFYKKIFRDRAPGKFKNDKHHHIKYGWKARRIGILLLYFADVAGLLIIAFLAP